MKKSLDRLDEYKRSGNFQVTSLIEPIRKSMEQVKADLDRKQTEHPDLLQVDPILDALTDLFDGKVGQPYEPEDRRKHLTAAKARFENKQPPGYMDSKKEGDRKYGDVLVWFQLLDYARTEKRPIVLVTDESSDDWWVRDHGKTIGPRPELLQEMHNEANGKWFYMYSTERFLEYSKALLPVEVTPNVIREAKEIKAEDEQRNLENLRAIAALLREGGRREAVLPKAHGYSGPRPIRMPIINREHRPGNFWAAMMAKYDSQRSKVAEALAPILAKSEETSQITKKMAEILAPILAKSEEASRITREVGQAILESQEQTRDTIGTMMEAANSQQRKEAAEESEHPDKEEGPPKGAK